MVFGMRIQVLQQPFFPKSILGNCMGDDARNGWTRRRKQVFYATNGSIDPLGIQHSYGQSPRIYEIIYDDLVIFHDFVGNCQGEYQTSRQMTGWWFGCHFLFSHRLGIIIPIDFHIFQRGSNQQPDEVLWRVSQVGLLYALVLVIAPGLTWISIGFL